MRPLLAALSPAGRRARLSVLIFHRVLAQPDPLFPDEIDANRFDAICNWIKNWFNVLPLDQAVRRLRDGDLPARAAAITFDDGYADNHDLALPILQRHGLSATFFIATGFSSGGCMWNDLVIEAIRGCRAPALDLRDLPGIEELLPLDSLPQQRHAIARIIGATKYLPASQRLGRVAEIRRRAQAHEPAPMMMDGAAILALYAAGMGIGAHTVSHPILSRLDQATARREMADGRARLEDLLQQRVGLFAYPNGRPDTDYLVDDAQMARTLGFDAAFSTAWGAAGCESDPYQLPRFTPWGRSRTGFGLRLARNLWRPDAQTAELGRQA